MIKVLKILHHILPSLGQTQVRRQRSGSLRRRAGLGVGSLIRLLLCSCSATKNLAENETQYVGIKEIAYDRMPKHQGESNDTTGVIAALGNAYNTVAGLIEGDASAREALNAIQGDSLAAHVSPFTPLPIDAKKDREAYATAKSEVEGALAHAPNNFCRPHGRCRWSRRWH